MVIFPLLINGYYWLNEKCRFTPLAIEGECITFQLENMFIAVVTNVCFAVIIFILIVCSVIYSKKRKSKSSSMTKIENHLIIQTFISSFFLILFYLSLLGLTIYVNEFDILTILDQATDIFFFFQHYPGLIIIFVVSHTFRSRFLQFYRISYIIEKCKSWRKKAIVSTKTVNLF